MSLLPARREPTLRQLRQFGAIGLIAVPLATWLWTRSNTAVLCSLLPAVALGTAAATAPRLLKPVFAGMMIVTRPIGIVMSEVITAAAYFGVISPIALVQRLFGRDRLGLRTSASESRNSCWRTRAEPPPAARYYRQS